MRFTASCARAAASRPWTTLAIWLLAAAASVAAVLLVNSNMTTKVGATGSESARAESLAQKRLSGGATHEAIVLRSQTYTIRSPRFRAEIAKVRDRLRALGARIEPQTPPSGGIYAALVLFELGHATVGPVDAMAARLDADPSFEAAAYGPHFLDHDFHQAASHDLRTGETYGVIAALVLLLLVFGTVVAALLPLALGLVATVVALALVTLLGTVFDLSVFVENIVAGMGLALGIDYTLFVLSRFREERAHGLDPLDAIERAGGTASKAVVVSGTVVAIALSSMLLVPDRVLRSLAAGAAVVTVVAVLAALTLLPALMRILGDGINRLALPVLGRRIAAARRSRFWSAVARRVTARPVPVLLVTSGLLIALATPAIGLRLGASGAKTLPGNLPSKRALSLFERSFASATAEPTRVVITGDTNSAAAQNGIGRLERSVQQDHVFFGPTRLEHVTGLTALSFYVRGDPGSDRALAAVRRLRNRYIPQAGFPRQSTVLVGGPTADSIDYVQSIKGSRLRVFAFVLALSFLLLMAAFRSLVVPLKAIVLNLLSVGAAYGTLVLVFQDGLGARLIGLDKTHAVEAWVPMLLFALLFGLSMDYHVFLLSRIREQYQEHRDTAEAVEHGIVSTGRIVTGAALVIVVVFASLAGGNLVMFQELGLGVAVALLLDATVVRVLLLPAAMSVLGRWNWFPSRLSREPVEDDDVWADAPTQRVERGLAPPRTGSRISSK